MELARPKRWCGRSRPQAARRWLAWNPLPRRRGKAIIQAALDSFGRIDILIHSAGIVRRSPLAEMSYEDFDGLLDVHLRGAFHVVRPAFR